MVCQKVKYDRGKAPGLLQPLLIPNIPWESISMDFIFGLPKSMQGNTRIWTILDRLVNSYTSSLLRRLLEHTTWPNSLYPRSFNIMDYPHP